MRFCLNYRSIDDLEYLAKELGREVVKFHLVKTKIRRDKIDENIKVENYRMRHKGSAFTFICSLIIINDSLIKESLREYNFNFSLSYRYSTKFLYIIISNDYTVL